MYANCPKSGAYASPVYSTAPTETTKSNISKILSITISCTNSTYRLPKSMMTISNYSINSTSKWTPLDPLTSNNHPSDPGTHSTYPLITCATQNKNNYKNKINALFKESNHLKAVLAILSYCLTKKEDNK